MNKTWAAFVFSSCARVKSVDVGDPIASQNCRCTAKLKRFCWVKKNSHYATAYEYTPPPKKNSSNALTELQNHFLNMFTQSSRYNIFKRLLPFDSFAGQSRWMLCSYGTLNWPVLTALLPLWSNAALTISAEEEVASCFSTPPPSAPEASRLSLLFIRPFTCRGGNRTPLLLCLRR